MVVLWESQPAMKMMRSQREDEDIQYWIDCSVELSRNLEKHCYRIRCLEWRIYDNIGTQYQWKDLHLDDQDQDQDKIQILTSFAKCWALSGLWTKIYLTTPIDNFTIGDGFPDDTYEDCIFIRGCVINPTSQEINRLESLKIETFTN